MDAGALETFYGSDMGQRTRRLVLRQLRLLWPQVRGLRVLGYGFAVPYLRALQSEAERVVAAMPAEPGALAWPATRCLSTLCEEDALPFADAFFDRVLVVHGLEDAQSLRPLLRQLWRVLAPEGKIVVVAANRASLWAQIERSPFGHGRPFSRGELDAMLRGALFEPERWSRALYAPPLNARWLTGAGNSWERVGTRFFPGLGGVHIAEARKSLYAPATPLTQVGRRAAARLSAAGTEN